MCCPSTALPTVNCPLATIATVLGDLDRRGHCTDLPVRSSSVPIHVHLCCSPLPDPGLRPPSDPSPVRLGFLCSFPYCFNPLPPSSPSIIPLSFSQLALCSLFFLNCHCFYHLFFFLFYSQCLLLACLGASNLPPLQASPDPGPAEPTATRPSKSPAKAQATHHHPPPPTPAPRSQPVPAEPLSLSPLSLPLPFTSPASLLGLVLDSFFLSPSISILSTFFLGPFSTWYPCEALFVVICSSLFARLLYPVHIPAFSAIILDTTRLDPIRLDPIPVRPALSTIAVFTSSSRLLCRFQFASLLRPPAMLACSTPFASI